MKSLGVSCVVVFLTGLVLISQGMTEENLVFFPTSAQEGLDPFGNDQPQDTVEFAPVDSVEALREQYLEVARQRASLMDESALRDAIESENSLVAELQAQQALQQVEQKLEQIIGEFPETSAGRRARRLLITLQATEDRNQPDLQPFPDRSFDRPDNVRRRDSDEIPTRDRPDFPDPRRDADSSDGLFRQPAGGEVSDGF